MNDLQKMQDLIEKKYSDLLKRAESMSITKDNIAEAAALQREISVIEKNFISSFEAEMKKRHDHYQEYQKKYKKFLDLIDKYDKTIRGKMLTITPSLSNTREILSDYGLSVVDNWKPRIDDESKIPREYMSVDTKKLNKVVSAMKEVTNIPGVTAINIPYIKRS
jgi:hypothetical protein